MVAVFGEIGRASAKEEICVMNLITDYCCDLNSKCTTVPKTGKTDPIVGKSVMRLIMLSFDHLMLLNVCLSREICTHI